METGAGNLGFKSIIHVAGINLFWFATEYSIRGSVKNAMVIVKDRNYKSVAFPIIGSGSGNRSRAKALSIMMATFADIETDADVRIVKFERSAA